MKSRRLVPERMDGIGHDPAVLRESLGQVAQVNRLLGGLRAFHHALRPFLVNAGDHSPSALRLLDVGTGNAELPLHLLEWSAARGAHWHLVGLDRHPEIAPIARARVAAGGGGVEIVRADALQLPFRDGSFDIVICALVLHHFGDNAAVQLVREMGRVARIAVLVNDLERSRPAAVGAHLLSRTLWRGNRLTRHDGPASVAAAFTAQELVRIGEEAGLVDVAVERHFPFRLLMGGSPRSKLG